jgi:hypothetical protein
LVVDREPKRLYSFSNRATRRSHTPAQYFLKRRKCTNSSEINTKLHQRLSNLGANSDEYRRRSEQSRSLRRLQYYFRDVRIDNRNASDVEHGEVRIMLLNSE